MLIWPAGCFSAALLVPVRIVRPAQHQWFPRVSGKCCDSAGRTLSALARSGARLSAFAPLTDVFILVHTNEKLLLLLFFFSNYHQHLKLKNSNSTAHREQVGRQLVAGRGLSLAGCCCCWPMLADAGARARLRAPGEPAFNQAGKQARALQLAGEPAI